MITYVTVPPQEDAFYSGEMLPNMEGDVAVEWANNGEVRTLLQKLLERPFDDVLGVASALPFGGLLDRHLVQLDALANDLKAHFDVSHTNASYAMHVCV